ncbi:VanZ family protein [Caldicellulosiruptor morganii]|uniref:VanZ family protein n=1 Tax=Caldicellulosiruptor morganii TaxID=1387555 RepID=A0ABY7BN51_9FIRM|nr:VanZ family protein [Caldicellulosiruptor morganii]WAM33950.1 VanZ family protein [Caldicellulosiruptor morganii]
MKRKIYIRWALVFVWMAVIFYFSSQEGAISHQKSFSIAIFAERIIEFIAGRDFITSANRKGFEFLIRKIAHVTEYFILSMLFYKAFFESGKSTRQCFVLTAIFSVLYAISDEIHQIFVSGRGPSPVDVMIDSIGIFGYMGVKAVKGRFKRSKQGNLQS